MTLGGTDNSITATDSTIYGDAGFSGTLVGSGDTFNLSSGGDSTVTISGSDDVIDGSNETINLDSGFQGTIVGNDDTINEADGSDTSVTISGSGETIYGGDDGGGDDGGGDDGGSGSGYYDPVVLNLSGKSVQTVGLSDSPAYFDMKNNGTAIQTGWITPGEGLLVDDPTDAPITNDSELIGGFGALQQLDSNGDGVLNASDAAWNQLRVWVDAAGTAQFQSGELVTLDQLGITSINLNATMTDQSNNGNIILDQSTFTTVGGGTGDIAGVGLVGSDSSSAQLSSLINGMAAFNSQGAASSSSQLTTALPETEHLAVSGVH